MRVIQNHHFPSKLRTCFPVLVSPHVWRNGEREKKFGGERENGGEREKKEEGGRTF